MVRSRRARLGFVLLASVGALLLVAAVIGARQAPRDLAFNTALLLPSALLGFAVLAVVAPLVAGGGYELYPDDQLMPHPVRPSTTFIASVIQTPLNLAWITQVLVLTAATSFAIVNVAALPGALVLLAVYVAAVTVLGQAVAWLVVGARHTRPGRFAVWLVASAVAVAASLAAWTHHVTALLDRAPTVPVVAAMAAGQVYRYVLIGGVLTAGAVGSGLAGVYLVAWSQQRPNRDRAVRRQASAMHRRPARATVYRQMLATDRASVWRSTPSRRGAVVTAFLPGALAATAGVNWFTITAIPGLVAAGAGLLFGVNVFSLDAQGALWLASQPVDPRLHMRAKVRVVAETCLAVAGCSLLLSTLHVQRTPTLSELVAAITALIACSAAVVAICTELSVSRPHRADLRGARDTPAPPGAMIGYSVRLATVVTVLGMTFGAIGKASTWIVSLGLSLTVTGLAAASVSRDLRRYADSGRRALIASTVANG
jgi:hypothetical protein